MEKKLQLIVVGHIGTGTESLANATIAAIKAQHQDVQIISAEQAREMKIDENTLSELSKVPFIITEPPKFPEIPEYKFNAYGFTGKSARNIRREKKRKKS